jgi:multidrug resistance efflux pump
MESAMPEIGNHTLLIAISAVAAEIRAMRAALADGEAEAEEYQALEDYERAAEDLERAYEITARTVINLPPYDELVGDSEDE